jgi:hypothetical protein
MFLVALYFWLSACMSQYIDGLNRTSDRGEMKYMRDCSGENYCLGG